LKLEMELVNYGKIERIYNIVAGGVQWEIRIKVLLCY
jgi:hypothetical protein